MSQTYDTTADLIAALNSDDKRTIRAAVDAMIPLAARSWQLAQTLERLLENKQQKNRWATAYILAHLPEVSTAVIGALLEALDHGDPDIRWAIGLLLVRLAKTEREVVQSLSNLCAVGTSTQRRMALYCLRDLNLQDKNSLRTFVQLLEDVDPRVRVAALIGLKGRGDLDVRGRRKILEIFSGDGDPRVRNVAAITLAELGSPCEEIVTALKEASASDNPQLKKAAASALAIIENNKVRSNR